LLVPRTLTDEAGVDCGGCHCVPEVDRAGTSDSLFHMVPPYSN
jgi:hypothetical protein